VAPQKTIDTTNVPEEPKDPTFGLYLPTTFKMKRYSFKRSRTPTPRPQTPNNDRTPNTSTTTTNPKTRFCTTQVQPLQQGTAVRRHILPKLWHADEHLS
jgi:hypothetical protein